VLALAALALLAAGAAGSAPKPLSVQLADGQRLADRIQEVGSGEIHIDLRGYTGRTAIRGVDRIPARLVLVAPRRR
jgi:hypothetical protein